MVQTPTLARHDGIDAFRYIAFALVVVIHAILPLNVVYSGPTADGLIQTFARWAVPFFFICSGYFIKPANGNVRDELFKIARRIGPVFIVWLLYYLIAFDKLGYIASHPKILPRMLLSGWPAYPLWFLPSLAICMAMFVIFRRYISFKLLLTAGLVLFAIGLACSSYRGLLGTPEFNWNMRIGPCFGFIFVVLGNYMAQHKIRIYPSKSWAIFAGGFALLVAELWFIGRAGWGNFAPNDFAIGMLLFGFGAFALAQTVPAQNALVKRLAILGRFSLGMYCAHLIVLEASKSIWIPVSLEQRLLNALAVIVVTTVTIYLLSSSKRLKPLIS